MHFEGLAGAINVSIVAFSIVFGVLLVLTGTIFAMKLFAGSKAPAEKKNEVKPVSKPAASVAAAPVTAPAVSLDKAKIVAAITAAIVEFTGNQNFKILSVTPEAQGSMGTGIYNYPTSRWKTAGILELNSNRLNRKWN